MITPSVERAVDHVLANCVRFDVDAAIVWPDSPLETETFQRVLERALDHHLLGALAEVAAHGMLPLSPLQRDQLTSQHTQSQAHMLRLDKMLLRVVSALGRAGVEVRVLKGLALSHVVYQDPAWRVSADIDILVPSESFDKALSILIAELGGNQGIPELRPGFDREFGKEALLRIDNLEVDVHRTLTSGPFGLTIDLDELFEAGQPLQLGGATVQGLATNHLFLHACYNAALGDYPVRLGAIRDLLLCLQHLDLDLDSIVETAQRWNGQAVVQRAVDLVSDMLGTDETDFAHLAALVVPRRQAWLLRSYLSPARSYLRPLASLTVLPGVGARIRYGRALLAPSTAYLKSRGWTKRTHLTRALDRLFRRG